MVSRKSEISRKTSETQIEAALNIDGTGKYEITSGIRFFDHMLESFTKHSYMDLKMTAIGDVDIDNHHTVEDVGIVLGEAFKKALGNKEAITRFASITLPMDEALVMCSVDVCGRPYLVFDYEFKTQRVGDFETECLREFLYAFTINSGICLHINVMSGANAHHVIEAIFKSLARCIKMSVKVDKDTTGIPSTKGCL
jgi:imidazoleglycerol-phosphate dehydratase